MAKAYVETKGCISQQLIDAGRVRETAAYHGLAKVPFKKTMRGNGMEVKWDYNFLDRMDDDQFFYPSGLDITVDGTNEKAVKKLAGVLRAYAQATWMQEADSQ